MFQRNVLPPSSGQKNEPSKQTQNTCEDDIKMNLKEMCCEVETDLGLGTVEKVKVNLSLCLIN
jgi:hypothetical protein